MKKIILILLLFSFYFGYTQTGEVKPITCKQLQTPNNVTFYFNIGDSAFWARLGSYGEMRIISKYYADRYLVPYNNANRDVDLNTNSIIAKGQNLPLHVGVAVMPTHIKNIDGTVTLGNNGVFNFSKNTDGSAGIIQKAITSSSTITLSDGVVNFIYADYGSGTPTYTSTLDSKIFKDDFTKIPVIRATREGTSIHFEEYDLYGILLANKLMIKDVYINGGRRWTGLILSTIPTRKSIVSSGSAIFAVQYYDNMPENIAGTSGLMYEYYLSSGAWNKIQRTSYDASYYSDGINRKSLNNSYWVSKYFWRDIGDDNEVYFIHGNQYNKESDAVNELLPAAPSVMTAHTVYVGKIVIQKDAINGTAYPRIWEGAVQNAGVRNHSDLSQESLVWNNSGHTGTINTIAGFDSGGLATNVTLTKESVGLGNVTNDAQVKRTEMGSSNGVATLDAGAKVPVSQLPATVIIYKGVWSPLTNTPTLTDGTGTSGYTYKANLSGSCDFGHGTISFYAGDWVMYNGSIWERSVGTDNVVSVNGQQGIVSLNTSHIPENTNLYYTDARARSAISLTTTGNSGASTYTQSTGVWNIPNYTLSGLGGEPALTKGNLTESITGLQFDNTRQVIGGSTDLSLTSGYVIPTTHNISHAEAGYTGRINSFTTTGTSGAATFSGNTLNIPQYQAAGSYEPANSNIQTHISNDGDLSSTNEIQAPTLSGNLIGATQTTTTIDVSQATAVLANTAKVTNATHTGDATGATELTLKTVNSNIGTYNNITINAKGLATGGTNVSYLTSESDPIYTASSWYTTTNNSSNWNTAYGWGNHAGLYLSLSGGTMNNTNLVTNLNADLLNGQHGSYYEPAFSKNTAFNKNFGTTTGTVLEGRTFGTAANSATTDFAPASGSANYIQNTTTQQTGNFNISGNGVVGGYLQSGLSVTVANKGKYYQLLNNSAGAPILYNQYQVWDGSQYIATNNYGFGNNALINNVGTLCVGIGLEAQKNNSGSKCAGIGTQVQYYNSGNACSGFGYQAQFNNSGISCTGFGYQAQRDNFGINDNSFGYNSSTNNAGNYINAFGNNSARYNVASYICGFGQNSLYYNNWEHIVDIGYRDIYFNSNSATSKTFTEANINATNHTITITSHGFGTVGNKVNLKFTGTATTFPTGLANNNIYQFTITDANTLTLSSITTTGSGLLGTLTKDYDLTNSIAIGYNTNPTGSNEIIFGTAATSRGNNTVTLGNSSIIGTYLQGDIYKSGIKLFLDKLRTGYMGTSGQIPVAQGTSSDFIWTTGTPSLVGLSNVTNNAQIYSLNGLTAQVQTLAIGTTGTAPNWSSATSTHTLNIPMASTTGVTAGLISKTDWNTFNAKLSSEVDGDITNELNASVTFNPTNRILTIADAGGNKTDTITSEVEDQIVDGITNKAPSQNAVYDALAGKESTLTKGTLTESVDGLVLSDSTRQVIGGSTVLGLKSGRVIPTATNISHGESGYSYSQIGHLPLSGGTMSNTNLVTNLNTDLLDEQHGSYYNNSAVTFNPTTKELGVTDGSGTHSATISITSGTGWDTSYQSLSGTTINYNVSNGINANITLSGNATINMSNVQVGMVGNISIINDATIRTLTFTGYTFNISLAIRNATNSVYTSGNNQYDKFTWDYDGVRFTITGEYNLQ